VALGQPGFAWEKEEGEIRLRRRLDREKGFLPEKDSGYILTATSPPCPSWCPCKAVFSR
jgi:hypothetical protein